jgi:3-hydroxyacyl-[acyl-carrier-protein] dehydratase
MLMNSFYTVQSVSTVDNGVTAVISFNAMHDIFKGHFPNQPVVPGVCTMEMVKEILSQSLHKKLQFRSSGNVKFLQLITPDVQPTINLKWELKDDLYWVNASFTNGEITMFKMDGKYAVAG